MGYEQLTGADAAQSLTVPQNSQVAFVAIEGGDARWRDDGTAPTSSVGMPLNEDSAEYLWGFLPDVQIYLATGVKANVIYYGGV